MNQTDNRQKVVLIAGPTASGKSSLAAALAANLEGVVINADAMQVYRELSILTARPSGDVLTTVPHRLYGVLCGGEACSAGRWRGLAMQETEEALAGGRLPILAGGTGLYLEAFEKGLNEVPEIPAETRAAVRAELVQGGPAALHAKLTKEDPAMAARLSPTDGQRVARAWEVLTATGRSLADWQREEAEPAPYDIIKLCLLPPREQLYTDCDRRLAAMLDQGALGEIRNLLALGLDPSLPVMKSLGVPEFSAYLGDECSLATALARAQQATRRYAKRQMTWLRHRFLGNDQNGILIETQYSESLLPEIFAKIRQILLTKAR